MVGLGQRDNKWWSKLLSSWIQHWLLLVAAVAVVVGAGAVYLISGSQAASSTVAVEPENGMASGGIGNVADGVASGGKAIKFSAAAPPPPPTTGWQGSPILLPPAGKVLFGVYDHSASEASAMEAQFGRHFDFTTTYNNYLTTTPGANAQTQLNAGRTPRVDVDFTRGYGKLGFNVGAVKNGKTLWASIAAGDFDADGKSPNGSGYVGVDSVLLSLKNLSAGKAQTNKIFVTLGHESDLPNESGGYNGIWAGTSAEYRAMWQHVYNRAHNLGISNISWFFNMAYKPESDSGNHRWGDVITDTGSDGMYPGNKYVDWVGWDPYNWASPTNGTPWKTFANIQNQSGQMAWWKAHFKVGGTPTGTSNVYKPVMLGESGTAERTGTMSAGDSGDAQAWLDGMAADVASGPDAGIIKAVCYFGVDYTPTGPDWAIYPSSKHPQKWHGLKDVGAASVFKN